MINGLRHSISRRHTWVWPIIAVVLMAAAYFGYKVSLQWLVLLVGGIAGVILLRYPRLGLLALIASAMLGKFEFGTGTEVNLNATALIAPALLGIWLLTGLRQQNLRLAPSRVNRPLVLFLVVGLLSIAISNVTWDPIVPRSGRFIVVQFAQWAIFAFSGGLFWLMGNTITTRQWLERLTVCFLIIGGAVSIIRALPGGTGFVEPFTTFTFDRAPFPMLMTALAGGQLLFNQRLSLRWRGFLVIIFGAILVFSFGMQQERASYWVGVVSVAGTLVWLRFPRLRGLATMIIILMAVSGFLFSAIYDFAGGDAKWSESGASRGVLIGRVIELSMRNPITGIGPAAYRPYGFTMPLYYEGAYWVEPRLNSHNNYIDLFSQVGLLGLGIFIWFMVELLIAGWRLRGVFKDGFAGGYLAGMLGAWVGSMIIMALADWILPFVYNIGFVGFQISALVWMFLGGIVSLETIARREQAEQ